MVLIKNAIIFTDNEYFFQALFILRPLPMTACLESVVVKLSMLEIPYGDH